MQGKLLRAFESPEGNVLTVASVAVTIRHPVRIRWSPYIEECIELLTKSPDAVPSDAWLCDLVRVQHIYEEVALFFSMDDPASNISLTDAKTQYHIRTFERQLREWRQCVTSDVLERTVHPCRR